MFSAKNAALCQGMAVTGTQSVLLCLHALQGISKLSCVLAMVGNAMMVPRALYTRDLIWFTGSTWGYTLMGWGQLLSLFLARDASGAR